MKRKSEKRSFFCKLRDIVDAIIYYLILIPLAIITIVVLFQAIKYPNEIPDVFGYEMFIAKTQMHNEIESGDLIFVKEQKIENLNKRDIIAIKNLNNKVELKDVKNTYKDEDKNWNIEINNEKTIKENEVEGKVIKIIPKIGAILLALQTPKIFLIIVGIILLIGVVQYLIARKLDLRDMKKMEELSNTKEDKKVEEKIKEPEEKNSKDEKEEKTGTKEKNN